MALIAAHLNAGHSGGDGVGIGIYSPSSPTSIPLPTPPRLPVPNKPYGFCGRKASCLFTYLLEFVYLIAPGLNIGDLIVHGLCIPDRI